MSNHPNRSKKNIPRPGLMLREIAKRYPDAWRIYDQFRQDRGKGGLPNWPDWCYCPMAAAHAVLSEADNFDDGLGSLVGIQTLAALSAWRVSQGIYRFDPDIISAITTTPIDTIPVEVLYHLPEWCVYIEAPPNMHFDTTPLSGFFAHLEWDANSGKSELRLLLDCADGDIIGLPLHLDQPTLDLALSAAIAQSQQKAKELSLKHLAGRTPEDIARQFAGSVAPMLNLVLYLCTINADFGSSRQPSKPQAKRTKRGWRLFPPEQPTIWGVGSRIGAALRATRTTQAETLNATNTSDGGRARPRAHVRRAHWHTYLTGEGKTNPILKWLPPIPVNVADINDLPATTHTVN